MELLDKAKNVPCIPLFIFCLCFSFVFILTFIVYYKSLFQSSFYTQSKSVVLTLAIKSELALKEMFLDVYFID